FTLIELMVVIAVILILAGLVLSISKYAMDKGARSRAEAEIAAMSAALESYKADNGIYPQAAATNTLDARQNKDATQSVYQDASFYLYSELSGLAANQQPVANKKSYFTFKPQMLGHAPGNTTNVTYIRDPWGNSYGYSTAYQNDLVQTPPVNPPAHGYNPTFDLWSTTNDTTGATVKWIKNW
ncbi:MAG: hypothetical protein DLM52_01905, partial [Chthoniobacterales bacterium]